MIRQQFATMQYSHLHIYQPRLNAFRHRTFSFLVIHFRYFMSISADADVGLSDIEIQGWLDDPLNAYIFRYFVHGQASTISIFEHVLTMKRPLYRPFWNINMATTRYDLITRLFNRF